MLTSWKALLRMAFKEPCSFSLDTSLKDLSHIDFCGENKFFEKIASHRANSISYTKTLLEKSQKYSTLKDMSENITNGRFSVNIGSSHFECLFHEKKGDYLYVSYNGARNPKKYTSLFPRWSYYSLYNGSYLGIDDPMFFSGFDDLVIGWYYGTKEHSYIQQSLEIVSAAAQKLHIANDHIIFFSSSGGGYAGLYASTLLDGSLSISLNPQLYIQNYIQTQNFEKITNISLHEQDELNRNNLCQQIREKANTSKHVIIVNSQSVSDFDDHLRPFCEDLGISIKYGLSKKDNILIWVYDAYWKKSMHTAFETRIIFSVIDLIAKEFYSGFKTLSFDSCQTLAIATNEMWRDYFLQANELYVKTAEWTEKQQQQVKYAAWRKDILFLPQDRVLLGKPTNCLGRIVVDATNNGRGFTRVDNLKKNTRYTIIIKKPQAKTVLTEFTAGLFDHTNKFIIKYANYPFDKDACLNFVIGETDSNICFCLFAGIYPSTDNHSIIVDDVLIFEQPL